MLPRPAASGTVIQRWLPLLLCVNLLLLAFYLAIDYQLVYHSDAAVKNLLAQEIVETGQYFPRDWNYVNSDLWVLTTHTFIVPLLPFMANGYKAALISDLVTAALILHGSWLVTGLLEQSRLARLLGMAALSAGMSLIMAEHVYGQAAYGTIYYVACYLLYAYWRLSQAGGARARLLWGGATVALAILAFWANPQRALLSYGLPLLAAAAAQQGLEWRAAHGARRRVRWHQAGASAALLLGMAAGILANKLTLQHVMVSAGLTMLAWRDFDGMLHNLAGVAHGVLALLDGLPRLDGQVASLAGAYAAARLLGGVVLLAVLPWTLLKALEPRRGPRQLVVLFTAVSLGANLFVVLTTSLADMAAPEASVRYLVPSLLLMVPVMTGVLVDRRVLAPLPRAAGLAALALLATSAPTSYLYPYNEAMQLPMRRLSVQTPDQDVVNFLRDQGLRYGYATFWNANKLTVLSAGAVKVRPVTVEGGIPLPMRKLSSNRWYRPEAWQGETFVMLLDEELKALDQPRMAALAGAPRVLRFRNLTVLVYPANIASVLPKWDLRLRKPEHYPVYAGTPHMAGHFEPALAGMVAAPGEAGPLMFGPARTLPPGSYDIGFDVETTGAEGSEFGFVDAVTGGATVTHARQTITQAGRQHVVLRLDTATQLEQLELRAFSSGQGQFIVRGADIAPHSQEKH
ncbi:hypothetical protein [Duganella callida]|uniref:Glycosyltransferase RgtA/B/C/D-like domain-containing protein n=1 Tax=Duganella callida TaxID=2561932 RepID=A0A4Y9SCH0_9BURK|nr:hypothetical protein [Duganella callida]TFW19767.1 hypothetical protein E4L98_15830 [Duganella callida]